MISAFIAAEECVYDIEDEYYRSVQYVMHWTTGSVLPYQNCLRAATQTW